MATWEEIEDFLRENYESDMVATFAGPNSYAAVVPHGEGSEVILVLDAGLMVQMVGFLEHGSRQNIDKVFSLLQNFGIKATGNQVVLHHVSMKESLDAMDLQGPMHLMAYDVTRINNSLGA
jgi:hypothetical protein